MRIIDLSQDVVHKNGNGQHIDHPTPLVFAYVSYEESRRNSGGRISGTSEWLNMGTHTGTHIDAPKHADDRPDAKSVDQLPLTQLYGEAVCLDVSHLGSKARITARDLQDSARRSGLEVRSGDIVLINTGHWMRTSGTPAYRTDQSGLETDACEWLLERGVTLFGVDATAPETREDQLRLITPVHDILKERGLLHIENLASLESVAGKRFTFAGFPIRIKGASAAPIRAVAFLHD